MTYEIPRICSHEIDKGENQEVIAARDPSRVTWGCALGGQANGVLYLCIEASLREQCFADETIGRFVAVDIC